MKLETERPNPVKDLCQMVDVFLDGFGDTSMSSMYTLQNELKPQRIFCINL